MAFAFEASGFVAAARAGEGFCLGGAAVAGSLPEAGVGAAAAGAVPEAGVWAAPALMHGHA